MRYTERIHAALTLDLEFRVRLISLPVFREWLSAILPGKAFMRQT